MGLKSMVRRTGFKAAMGNLICHAQIVAALVACGPLAAGARPLKNWDQVAGGQWTVPKRVVAQAAEHVQNAADNSAKKGEHRQLVGEYMVQYQGIVVNGKHRVRLAGACRVPAGIAYRPRLYWLDIIDGRKCFYDAEYDPALKSFISFQFGSEA